LSAFSLAVCSSDCWIRGYIRVKNKKIIQILFDNDSKAFMYNNNIHEWKNHAVGLFCDVPQDIDNYDGRDNQDYAYWENNPCT
jgi:hypothetical protein